ncbi:MAG: hypothetical protein PWP23_31 [Candidatus Sumerlaeota bacterium]|nr:hypothetical protein [Candidatus Sumerlaeota bacterium]
MKKEIAIQLALLAGALVLMLVTVISKRNEAPVEILDEELLTLLETGGSAAGPLEDGEAQRRFSPTGSAELPEGSTEPGLESEGAETVYR